MARTKQPPLDEERRRLAADNVGLAFRLAREYATPGRALDDLISRATWALCRCAARYRPGAVPFGAYAARSIRLELRKASAIESARAARFAALAEDPAAPAVGAGRAERAEVRAEVRRLLRLAGPYAPALRMYYLRGMTPSRIARNLGLASRQAAEGRVKAGLRAIRLALAARGAA